MKIPSSGGKGTGPLPRGEKVTGGRSAGSGRSPAPKEPSVPHTSPPVFKNTPLLSSPLVRLMGDLLKLEARLDGGEILDRLAQLPPEERKQALMLHLLLAKRGTGLSREEWRDLWLLVREKSLDSAAGEEGEDLFSGNRENHTLPIIGEEVYLRLFRRDGGRGSALLSLDGEREDGMSLSLQKGGRSWEFLLRKKRDSQGRMEVYTDDEGLIDDPPASWEEFRKNMAGYGISVEKSMKILQEDSFFSDTGNREPDHMVDIVL